MLLPNEIGEIGPAFRLPDAIAKLPDLGAGEKLLFAALTTRAGRGSFCFVSIRRLASDLGVSPRTVKRHLAALLARGLVNRAKGAMGRSTRTYFPGSPIYAGAVVRATKHSLDPMRRIHPHRLFEHVLFVPEWLASCPDLSASSKLVYSALLRVCWNGVPVASAKLIGSIVGRTRAPVFASFSELQEYGLIERAPSYELDGTVLVGFTDLHDRLSVADPGSRAVRPRPTLAPPGLCVAPQRGL